MIHVTIDGRKIEVELGTTVLEACRSNDINIPTLCYQSGLTPYGGCRLCLVEVDGFPRPTTACTLQCSEGMVVRTDTPLVKELRRFSLQLILSEHPYVCLVCTQKDDCATYMECIQKEPITFGCKYCIKNGSCELQELVEELQIKDVPFDVRYKGLEIERDDPFFERDYNLCILCGRCVRTCIERRGVATLDFHKRGSDTRVGTAYNLSHLDVDCQFCGSCVDACPTGALAERFNKYEGPPDSTEKSLCTLCSIGCRLIVKVKEGRLIGTGPDNNDICVRGRFAIAQLCRHRNRITKPMIRHNDRIVEVGWGEALDVAASALKAAADRVGVVFTPDIALEAMQQIPQIGITHRASYVDPDRSAEVKLSGVVPENMIVVNNDMVEDFSVLLLQIRGLLGQDPFMVTIDPVENRLARKADVWLRPEPGREVEIALSLVSDQKIPGTSSINVSGLEHARRRISGKPTAIFAPSDTIVRLKAKCSDPRIKFFGLNSSINYLSIHEQTTTTLSSLLTRSDIDTLYLIGGNPKLSKSYKCLIVQDLFPLDCQWDVFLPVTTYIESGGTFVSMFGSKTEVKPVITPPGLARDDVWVITELARRVDANTITQTRKDENMITRRETGNAPAGVTKDFPVHLIVRNNAFMFRSRPLSSLLRGFARIRHDDKLWISPQDAKELAREEGDMIQMIGRNFSESLRIHISDRIQSGSVFAYCDVSRGIDVDQCVRLECTAS